MTHRIGGLLMTIALLAGCAQTGEAVRSAPNFETRQLGKMDIDRVADIHRREVFASLRVLADKLYRRNPREWKKGGQASREAALDRLFDPRNHWRLPELGNHRGTDAVLLALSADYTGDRIAAYTGGLGDMLNVAFGEKDEFFLFDSLDPQKLYNSARNLEIAAWKLAAARDANGQPLLLSNASASGEQPANLSFEREFGKMIANLDLLAAMLAERGQRTIARTTQSIATAVFLPVIGI
jgi:hypothetical protein